LEEANNLNKQVQNLVEEAKSIIEEAKSLDNLVQNLFEEAKSLVFLFRWGGSFVLEVIRSFWRWENQQLTPRFQWCIGFR
jgi:uncharacterized coiled-coil DUF342 family protein